MPRAVRPPSLPPDLVDGLLDGLRRVSAVADLLGTVADPALLREGTITEAAGIIGGEAERMLGLVRGHEPSIHPEPSQP